MQRRKALERNELDEIDVKILECISETAYAHRSEIHRWVMREIPSIAMLQRRLEKLEEEGYLRFELWKGYRRTGLGTEKLRELGEI